jgi:membrane-bound serine protease (ClpP class)
MSSTMRAAIALLLALLWPDGLPAQEARGHGLIVQVPTTITTAATNRLRSDVVGPLRRYEAEHARDPKAAGTFYLVCDFNPDGRPNTGDDFGACYSLADCLEDLRKKHGIEVVAFVHGDVTGHAVLPVLACSQILMSSDPPARLGKVAGPDRPLKPRERSAYADIAGKRYPSAIVRKMYEPQVVLIKSLRGERYQDGNDKSRPVGDAVPGFGAGDTALYSFGQAREFGLCQGDDRYHTLDDVRDRYALPQASLYPPLDRVVAWRIRVEGTLNGELQEKVRRRVRAALGQKANLLIFQLDCGDGDWEAAAELGRYLASLNDNREQPIRTLAFVTNRARNTAAFLAFGCNEILMQREVRQGNEVVQQGARLGDFDRYVQGRQASEADMRRALAELAARQHYPAILAEGLLDRQVRIVAVVSSTGASARKFLSGADLEADQQGARQWRVVDTIKPTREGEQGKYLTLTAEKARECGVARDLAANWDEVCSLEGVEQPNDVRVADSDWLDALADFLRDPWTSVVLVMLGITCLLLELKMPGVTLPGVISAVCFLLFFWSHSQLNGQIAWLAFLLFLLGLVLIALEVFVLPGFGVAGISGLVLVLGSLGLVAYGHWPHSNDEWLAMGQKIGPFGISILGALAVAFLVARYLPHIPFANQLMLKPPDEAVEAGDEPPATAVQTDLSGLLGAIGVAATPLRPAGKTQFGDDFIDVVAEGTYVQPGSRVQVIEIEGNRVVVKEV